MFNGNLSRSGRSSTSLNRSFILITVFIGFSCSLSGQGFLKKLNAEPDTGYVESYLDHLTSRLYASVKTANVILRDNDPSKSIVYRPNSPLIVGFGFNYGILGLNIGFNLPFLNDDEHKRGKTTYKDLQTHVYLRPVTLDIYLQLYEGYYQTDPNNWYTDWPVFDTLPQRPDVKSVSVGLNGQYIFNHKRFSYRAAFLQNEWQKKSAGSFLAGGTIFFADVMGDHSLIPSDGVGNSFFEGLHFSQFRMVNGGLTAGYTHTFVAKQHFFLTLSLVGGLSGGGSWLYTSEKDEVDRSGFTLAGNLTGRAAVGYNSRRFYTGFSYLGIFNRNQSPIPKTWLGLDVGMFRFNIVYRFKLKKDYRVISNHFN